MGLASHTPNVYQIKNAVIYNGDTIHMASTCVMLYLASEGQSYQYQFTGRHFKATKCRYISM